MAGKSNKKAHYLALIFILAVLMLFTGCKEPSIKKPHSGHADATIPEAVEANTLALKELKKYQETYGPKETYGMVVKKNFSIPMRDGSVLKADIFRPDKPGKFPTIMSMTAYMKDRPWPVPDNHEAQQGKYQVWEVPNPDRWVPLGYVLVRVDTRGFGQSTGAPAPLNDQEANDYYDAIEWAAKQSWSNTNIGLSGVSYIAINQWYVAGKQPLSLKAIMPWEGLADQYRDSFFRGGIFGFAFSSVYMMEFLRDYGIRQWPHAQKREWFKKYSITEFIYNNLDNEFWKDRKADWDKVKVPVLSVGNWGGWMGAGHLRGNLEGFKRAASPHKKLRVHTGGHQDAYYSQEGFLEQLRWFDYWLKGIKNGVMDEPPVKLAIRNGTDRFDFTWRYENEWPIARTQYNKMYLNTEDGSLGFENELPQVESSATYDAPGGYKDGDNRLVFVSDSFKKDTEITGEIKLNLWVSSSIDDMKVHSTVMIIQPTLSPLLHKWYGEREIVTTGWLSAQHRELDPDLSTDSRPYHRHKAFKPLVPGEPTEIQVEIWPTSMVFRKGSRLALILSADHPMTVQVSQVGTYRERHAKNTIHTGGKYNSYLQVPVIPPKP